MSKVNDKGCPLCGGTLSEVGNRLITDSCGHRKCRNCLIKDDECLECKKEISTPEGNIVHIRECNVVDNANSTDGCQESKSIEESTTKANGLCSIRKEAFPDSSLPAHLKKNDSGYVCTICSKKFQSRTQKYYHYNCNNTKDRRHKCQQCEKCFSTKFHLNYHLEIHKNKIYNCVHCGKAFRNALVLRKHEKLHCRHMNECKGIQSKKTYDHAQFHQDTEPFAATKFDCKFCERQYFTKASLTQHMQQHNATPTKSHECSICGKKFQRNSILKIHFKRHSKTDAHMCSLCCKQFSDVETLKRHSNSMHSERLSKYKCQLCDTITKRKDNMLRHIRNMHTAAKFEDCVLILQELQNITRLTPMIVNHQEDSITLNTHNISKSNTVLAPIFTLNQRVDEKCTSQQQQHPKTIANSSVIKFIGKVEPIQVPLDAGAKNSKRSITGALPGQLDHAVALTTTDNNFHIKKTINSQEKQRSLKKEKRLRDPLEIYRKILSTEDDDDVTSDDNDREVYNPILPLNSEDNAINTGNTVVDKNCNFNNDQNDLTDSTTARQEQKEETRQRDGATTISLHASNFSETHWRKNYKFLYQPQEY